MDCVHCSRRDFIRLALGASAALASPFGRLLEAAEPKAKAKAKARVRVAKRRK